MVCKIRINGHEANIRIERECLKDDLSSFAGVFVASMRALGVSDYELASQLCLTASEIGGPDFAE
jgi:hypothetical protein